MTDSPPTAPAPEETVPLAAQLELEYLPRINLALERNRVPLVRRLRLHHLGDAPWPSVKVELGLDPAISPTWSASLDGLSPGATHNFDRVDLPVGSEELEKLGERSSIEIWGRVTQGERESQNRWRLDLLPYGTWTGLDVMPELVMAHVLPDQAGVASLVATARAWLERETGRSSIDGYRDRDPDRIRLFLAGLYDTLRQRGLARVDPAPGFTRLGERIRTPDEIAREHKGTPLDLATWVAAALESVGLFAVITIYEDEVAVGVWTREHHFPDPVVDDSLWLRKRSELGDVVSFGVHDVWGASTLPFDDAVHAQLESLGTRDDFECAIDGRAARIARVLPLGHRRTANDSPEANPASAPETTPDRTPNEESTVTGDARDASVDRAPATPDDAALEDTTASSPATPSPSTAEENAACAESSATTPAEARRARWRRRLLDLTLRNRLLNFVSTKKTLPLHVADPARLEDALSLGRRFTIETMPESLALDAAALPPYLTDRLERGELITSIGRDERDRRLVEIYRAARLGLQEGGANTLYLAIGFLHWFESSTATDERRAPLILLPLTLERSSARAPFSLELSGEGPQINTTLTQKLESEFDLRIEGLDELPEDEAGIDVEAVLRAFREAVVDVARWEVRSDAAIGIFSFTKFLMWRDLGPDNPRLSESPGLELLLGQRHEAAAPEVDLDAESTSGEVFCPLDADSSQLAAVLAAERGSSFVLEGPPGTGKSQTITNLIAQALGRGKTVLFVSEKIAALEVVHRRLRAVGLGPACLELHSNKTRKSEVIARLAEALDPPPTTRASDEDETLVSLAAVHRPLSEYVERLHASHPLGFSLFAALDRLIALGDGPRFDLTAIAVPDSAADGWRERHEALERLVAYSRELSEPAEHRFRAVRRTDWQPGAAPGVESAIDDVLAAAERLAVAADEALSTFDGTPGAPGSSLRFVPSRDWLDVADRFAATLLESPALPARLLSESDGSAVRAAVEEWIEWLREIESLRAELEPSWSVDDLLSLDLDRMRTEIRRSIDSYRLWRWWKLRKVRAELTLAGGKGAEWSVALGAIERAQRIRDLKSRLAGDSGRARELLGRHFRGDETDPSLLAHLLDRMSTLRELARRSPATVRLGDVEPAGAGDASASSAPSDDPEARRLAWSALLEAGDERLGPTGDIGSALTRYRESWSLFLERLSTLERELAVDPVIAWGEDDAPAFVPRCEETLRDWRTHLPELRDWCLFVRQRVEVDRLRLDPITRAWWRGEVDRDGLIPAFERSFLGQWADGIVSADPTLRDFHGLEHTDQVRRFRELDRRVIQLNPTRLGRALEARRPVAAASSTSESSEVGLILREAKKKRAHLAVREVLRRIPNLLPRLKPCLLMSPLSVAQYLHWELPAFDLVVFDEASQIPTWDAIGAIARGDSVVVVGDGRQLPPTSFFESTDPEELEWVEDSELESILDESIAAGLPRRRLRWHYRSRDENLIAFSNHHYYDGELITFPHARGRSPYLGVSMRHLGESTYDRGGSQTNAEEARALVDELVARLRSEEERDRSFGIVTLNIHQQALIEDLLDAARRDHPEIDAAFLDSAPEPVFVKNLENVQGDERDVIFISIGYGRDARGRVSMNFGPLNRLGGERRLNVAITRAREQLVVWTNLTPEDIDLRRTGSVGVRHLKGFLEYASRGASAMAEAGARTDSPLSSLVGDVASALRDRGWTVDCGLGRSQWRLDIAVRGRASDGYLAAIETDGGAYAGARTTRDRDRLRSDVLGQLDWSTLRLWSIDWWQSRETELERLDRALASWDRDERAPLSLTRSNQGRTEPSEARAEARPSTAPEPPRSEESDRRAGDGVPTGQAVLPGQIALPGAPKLPRSDYDPEVDLDGTTARIVRARVETVERLVDALAPIATESLFRRLADHWQIARMTRKIRGQFESLLTRVVNDRGYHEDDDGFLWRSEEERREYGEFRVPTGDEAREFEEIAPAEIRHAALALLRQHVALPVDDLAKEVSRLFGSPRVTPSFKEAVTRAAHELSESGAAQLDSDGTARLPREADTRPSEEA